jgi:hypothetical protein
MSVVTRAWVSPEEVYPGRNITYADLSAFAGQLNKSEALKFLGFLNLVLSAATTETRLTNRLEPVRDVQIWVLQQIVSTTLAEDLKRTFPSESLLDRPILHRTQLMFAIRLVATHGLDAGGNMLSTREERNLVGDLLFLTNGLFKPVPAADEAEATLWLATELAGTYETENPPAIELSWPRIEELLITRLPASSPDRAETERLEQIAVFNTGFSNQAWMDICFMLFSFWADAKFGSLLNDPSRGYLDPARPHEVISTAALNTAVAGLSARFDQLTDLFRIDQFSRETLFDLTPFRKKPLWLMPNGLVMCVDSALLTERLGPHVFWSVMNALDTPERRNQFGSTWGGAFESYVLDRLGDIFRGRKWNFNRNPVDEATNEELWDGFAVRDDTLVAIECKGTFIRSADKYSGVLAQFEAGISQKFGIADHGGVFQLVRGISNLWLGRTARSAELKTERIADVFPVLIVQDPLFGCGPVSKVLSDQFQTAIEAAKATVPHKIPKIWPLTVITADELDQVAYGILATGQRLDSMLKRFHRTHPSRIVSLGDFAWKNCPEFGFPEEVQKRTRATFTATSEAVMERFRNAEYGARLAAQNGGMVSEQTSHDG